jgi:hypothetical protein
MNIDEPGRNLYRALRVAERDMGVLSAVIDWSDLVRLLGELESGQDVLVMVLESTDPEYIVPHVDLFAQGLQTRGPLELDLGDRLGRL